MSHTFLFPFHQSYLFGWFDFITQCAKCQGNFGNGRKKSWRAESPAAPAFSFASAPIPPPTPFPSGEGGDYKLILPGAPPPAPRHQTVYGTDSPCRCSTPAGGLPSWLPAAPAFSLLFCPLHRRGRIDSPAPIPLPALAERSSQWEGGDFSFLMQGAPPLASPRLSRKRHGLNLRGKYPEGGGRRPGKARARGGG